MRTFFKEPIYEFQPPDNTNSVPFIYRIREDGEFKLLEPYPYSFDPTRRVANYKNFHFFIREELEMYHMSFVRKNMRGKLENVSNRANYGKYEDFLQKFEEWTPEKGVLHPHPYIGKLFKEITVVENHFHVDITQQCAVCCKSQNLLQCGRCKKPKYCSSQCQKYEWPKHKLICKSV